MTGVAEPRIAAYQFAPQQRVVLPDGRIGQVLARSTTFRAGHRYEIAIDDHPAGAFAERDLRPVDA